MIAHPADPVKPEINAESLYEFMTESQEINNVPLRASQGAQYSD